ncbi:MAG: YhcH/YjgK/YiaL family protein [Anaerocolumna sp.]
MILDQIVNFERYKGVDTNIKKALEFIYSHKDDADMPDGKYEIAADEVNAFVISKDTVDEITADMEIHKKFMDIHYMLKGKEKCCLVNPPEDIDEYSYDDTADITFFKSQRSNYVVIDKGEFYAVWPFEPHKPLCNVNKESEFVKKIICKVKI